MLPLEKLEGDETLQARVEYNSAVISSYIENYQHGIPMAEPVVFFDGETHWLADGFYRREAAGSAGKKQLKCKVYDGTKQDAQWYACAANARHGQPRTNKDKRRAAEMALLHPNGSGMSDSQIGKYIGVSQPTVGAVRKRLEKDGQLKKFISRDGADGRKRNTSRIGGGRKSKPKTSRSPAIQESNGSTPPAPPKPEEGVIVFDPPKKDDALQWTRHWWSRMNEEERELFLEGIGATR